MNYEELNYLDLLKQTVDKGVRKSNRTGIDTLSLFGTQLRFSLADNTLPLLTTKKMFTKGIVEELLFFLRGETNTKILEERGVNIWKGNTSKEFLKKVGLGYLPEGDMGYGYGFQWRHFGGQKNMKDELIQPGIDQLKIVIDTIKNNPDDRRIIMSAWNPSQLKFMVLPPCHMFVQFFVDGDQLSSQFLMRSVDLLLGLPFNIASYAILTHVVAKVTKLHAKELIFVGGDTHCYLNHIDAIHEQLKRKPFEFPKLLITKEINTIKDVEELEYSDFQIRDYQYYPAIKATMAV